MVDYHTRKKISPETKVESDIFLRVWSSIIAPSTEGSMFFIILNDISLVAY
jgi:hypothetical protein